MEKEMSELIMQIIAGLIIAAIIGAGSSMFILYKCVHKQARKINRINKGFVVVLKLLLIETKKYHPESEYTEIDKIYKEIVNDSD